MIVFFRCSEANIHTYMSVLKAFLPILIHYLRCPPLRNKSLYLMVCMLTFYILDADFLIVRQ